MRSLQLYVYAALTVTLAGCVQAQDAPTETPRAKLVEAISTVESTCEHRNAIVDGYLNELNNNPASQGYVVIYPATHPGWLARSREKELRRQLEMRRFDSTKMTIIAGAVQRNPKIEYWLVPPGADNPKLKDFDGAVDAPPFEQISRPTNFTEANPDHCNWGELYLEEYATELSFGWDYPGRVVIHAKTLTSFQKKKTELTAKLAEYDVSAKRLTFVRKPAVRGEEWVELWILPVRNGVKPKIERPPPTSVPRKEGT